MSFKTPLLCDRRVFDKKGIWKSPNNDIGENIFYYVKEPLTLVASYDPYKREEMKEGEKFSTDNVYYYLNADGYSYTELKEEELPKNADGELGICNYEYEQLSPYAAFDKYANY